MENAEKNYHLAKHIIDKEYSPMDLIRLEFYVDMTNFYSNRDINDNFDEALDLAKARSIANEGLDACLQKLQMTKEVWYAKHVKQELGHALSMLRYRSKKFFHLNLFHYLFFYFESSYVPLVNKSL